MDILNWLYMTTNGLARTKANEPKTDLVALGANVGFGKRGDKYQTYSMPLADAVKAGTDENNTYRTGIFDAYPFIITPSMVKSSTVFEQNVTPIIPFVPLGTKFETYKITGVIDLTDTTNSDAIFLGTLDYLGLSFGAFKITGTVSYTDAVLGIIDTPLSTNSFVLDETTVLPTPATFIFNEDNGPGFRDLYLIYDAPAAIGNISCYVTFEYEIIFQEGTEVVFTY
jgi:hypothetical protein